MKERRDSTWVTPLRSMCHLGIFQLPLLMLLSKLAVMMEDAMDLPMSNTAALLDLEMALSAYTCHCNPFSSLSSRVFITSMPTYCACDHDHALESFPACGELARRRTVVVLPGQCTDAGLYH